MSEQIEEQVDKLLEDCDAIMDKIADSTVTPSEAEELSNKFLGLTYRINARLRDLRGDGILLEGVKDIVYSQAFGGIDEKANVSKAKAMATANPTFQKSSIKHKRKDNEIKYWSGNYDIMNNAHIFYKMLCKD